MIEGFDVEANMRNSTFSSQSHRSSQPPSTFPDAALPALAQLIASRTGSLGKERIIEAFLASHPTVAKRQVHHAIVQIGVREKRGADTRARWCVPVPLHGCCARVRGCGLRGLADPWRRRPLDHTRAGT